MILRVRGLSHQLTDLLTQCDWLMWEGEGGGIVDFSQFLASSHAVVWIRPSHFSTGLFTHAYII